MKKGKVLSFEQALEELRQEEEGNHEHACPHCETKHYFLETFANGLADCAEKSGGILFDALMELAHELYDDAYEQGKTDALENIMDFAGHQLYGHDEE